MMLRALARLADAAVRVAFAWALYQLARWLLVVDRGLGVGVEVAFNVAPLRPREPESEDDEDDALGPFRDASDGRR